jgi:hypothetical protein
MPGRCSDCRAQPGPRRERGHEDTGKLVVVETEKWAKVIRAANIKPA